MTTTKTIKITGQEILEYYVSVSEDCTIAEARDILEKVEIFDFWRNTKPLDSDLQDILSITISKVGKKETTLKGRK